jgi:hypothetical protein
MALTTHLADALRFMTQNPDRLEQKPNEMLERLKEHCDGTGQGSANDPTPHEACIAVVLEDHGIRLAPVRNVVPEENGLWFWYQPGGTQQKGDFLVFEAVNRERTGSCLLDAKHSNGNTFYLNDGWFWEDILYIVSFCRNVRRGVWENFCFIGRGQDIPTDKDKEIWTAYTDAKKAMNASRREKEPDFLQPYFRFAHQYSCKQFTPEFTASRLELMLASLAPSP